jgi:maleylpyruvate isomerase
MMEQVVQDVLVGQQRAAEDFKRIVDGLDAEALAGPSLLAGWSRAHVLAHLEGVSRAMERQVEYALRGESVAFYDGGMEGRERAMTERLQRTTQQQKEGAAAAIDAGRAAFAGVSGAGWEGRTAYRNGTVLDAALSFWRELVVHASDLDAGPTPADWDDTFCIYLVRFLDASVPPELALELHPDRRAPSTIGAGERRIAITGTLQGIAAWLAGRSLPGSGIEPPVATENGAPAELPEPLPWPPGMLPKL